MQPTAPQINEQQQLRQQLLPDGSVQTTQQTTVSVSLPPQQQMMVNNTCAQMPMGGGGVLPVPMPLPSCGGFDPNAVLANLTHVVIREKVRMSQILLGWEQPNVDQIENKFGQRGFPVFYAQERSGCFERQCCPDGVRGWEMEILFNQGGAMGGYYPYLRFEKPTACACCCFCRPSLDMYDINSGYLAGSIDNPFHCCGMKYIIKDNQKNPVLEVHGSNCQLGMCCRCPCAPCADIQFEIRDVLTKNRVGMIRKTWGGVLRDWVSDAGLYEVEFGQVRHPQFKGLVLACALFLSEEYFTRGGQSQRDNALLPNIMEM